jgi:iron complex outermembrane receptor protein
MKLIQQNSNKYPSGTVGKQLPLFVLIVSALTAFPAVAQDSDTGLVLEEVIVTAQKREASLMDTGIAITAFSSEKLKEFGIKNLDDLSANTPGLSISSSERITIRGVGIDQLQAGIDPAVATYMGHTWMATIFGVWARTQ